MKLDYYAIKYLWRDRRRVWTAWVHFRRYRHFYDSPKQLHKLFDTKNRRPFVRALSYVLNNAPSFDISYFPDMEKAFIQRLYEKRARA